MSEAQTELCGKCGADADPTRRVDFTPKRRYSGLRAVLRQRNSTVYASAPGLVQLILRLAV
jgi:hypothetical protein